MNLVQRLRNSLIRLFKREKWAYVRMFTINGVKHNNKVGKVYIHCYESNNNSRKVSISSTFHDIDKGLVDEFAKVQELYQEKIVRWLDGRYDPDILQFSQVGEETV